jgi:hypothetical protein
MKEPKRFKKVVEYDMTSLQYLVVSFLFSVGLLIGIWTDDILSKWVATLLLGLELIRWALLVPKSTDVYWVEE